MRRSVLLVILMAGAMIAAGPVLALQETPAGDPSPTESPSPAEEEEVCQIGQVCTEFGDFRQERRTGPINDPPGDHLQSLVTIGVIALLAGTYLFTALTGRSLPNPFRGLRSPRR